METQMVLAQAVFSMGRLFRGRAHGPVVHGPWATHGYRFLGELYPIGQYRKLISRAISSPPRPLS
jgi:hypothetical protein